MLGYFQNSESIFQNAFTGYPIVADADPLEGIFQKGELAMTACINKAE